MNGTAEVFFFFFFVKDRVIAESMSGSFDVDFCSF